MREYINRVGKLIPKTISLGQERKYYGRREYNRFYGFYSLRGVSLSERIRMLKNNV